MSQTLLAVLRADGIFLLKKDKNAPVVSVHTLMPEDSKTADMKGLSDALPALLHSMLLWQGNFLFSLRRLVCLNTSGSTTSMNLWCAFQEALQLVCPVIEASCWSFEALVWDYLLHTSSVLMDQLKLSRTECRWMLLQKLPKACAKISLFKGNKKIDEKRVVENELLPVAQKNKPDFIVFDDPAILYSFSKAKQCVQMRGPPLIDCSPCQIAGFVCQN